MDMLKENRKEFYLNNFVVNNGYEKEDRYYSDDQDDDFVLTQDTY